MRNIEKYEGEKYFIVDDSKLGEVLSKIEEIIGIEKTDDSKILVKIDSKVSDDITLKGDINNMRF